MAPDSAVGCRMRVPSPALIDFSDDEEGGGAVFAPGSATDDQPPSARSEREPAGKLLSPIPLPRPSLLPSPAKVNSVRVPFDPDDQSDDEVIVTSVYKKRTATATNSGESGSSKGDTSSHNGSSNSRTRNTNASGSSNANAKDHRQASTARRGRPGSSKKASHSASPRSAKSVGGRGTDGNSSSNRGSGPFPGGTPTATAPAAKAPEKPLAPLSEITVARGLPSANLVPGSVYPGKKPKFCPWSKVLTYHTQFVGKANGVRVAPYFALGELLRCQDWDLCYLWHPAKDKQNTFVLVVPTEQVMVFLERINKTLEIHLTTPVGDQGAGFRAVFGSQQTPVPRFLGHARDPAALDVLLKNIPPRHPDDAITTPQSEAFYLKKINSLVDRPGGKAEQKKIKSDKAKKKRAHERRRWGRQAKRIQRYLGLRKRTAIGDYGASPCPRVLDLTNPPPFEPEGDVLFVALDIESYEHNHSVLTEIGFATLDTRDVAGVPPGSNGEGWHKLIQARHIRIRENAHLVNRHFLQGCENNFNFGTSEFVRRREILPLVTAMLQPSDSNHVPRSVILVGHDIRSDISLVKSIEFHVKDGMFLEVVDTQDLHQHFRLSSQHAGLRTVLRDLDIEHMFLHNAGNDAVYTMQAMISLIIGKRQNSLRKQNERRDASYKPDMEAVEQGWDTGGELSDGGLPDDDISFEDSQKSASENTVDSRPSSCHGTSRTTTPASTPASQKANPVVPWPVLGHATAPPAVAAWPTPADDSDDLIFL